MPCLQRRKALALKLKDLLGVRPRAGGASSKFLNLLGKSELRLTRCKRVVTRDVREVAGVVQGQDPDVVSPPDLKAVDPAV